jgi:hypothetical protein
MTTNTTGIHRVAAGAVLAAALALIALGTATAPSGNAESNSTTSPSFSPTPVQKWPGYEPWSRTPYGTYQNDNKRAGHH